MNKDNRTMRREIFKRYEEIANEKRLTIRDASDLTGINRNTLTGSVFISDRPMYLNLFIKLCLGLDALPSELLGLQNDGKAGNETTEDVLSSLDGRQLRAVLIHALSYMEGRA